MALDSRRLLGRATGLLLLGIAGYYAVWGGEYSSFDLLRLHQQQRANDQAVLQLRSEVDSLRAFATLLASDSATLETVARERFGMIREGEILYRFVDIEPDSVSAPQP